MGDYYFDKKKKKKPGVQYDYSFGDVHPGFHIGHKHCTHIIKGLPVPARMGWLWDEPDITGKKCPRGWQPGMIGKSILNMMTFKCVKSAQDKDRNKKKKRKRKGVLGHEHDHLADSDPEDVLIPKPALKVKRKGNMFTIQVNPLKDLTEIKPYEDPYADCEPIVCKIIKKRSPEEQSKAEAHKLIRMKKQRDAEIRKALTEATEDICKCAYMDVYCNDLTAIDHVISACPEFSEPACVCHEDSLSSLSSDASWDIEYTPPFGCFELTTRRKKHFIHIGTQYVPADAGILESKVSKVKCKKPSKKLLNKKKQIKRSCCTLCKEKQMKRSCCNLCQ